MGIKKTKTKKKNKESYVIASHIANLKLFELDKCVHLRETYLRL